MTHMPWIRCARCRELKPRDQFPTDNTKRSGARGICLQCEPPTQKPNLPETTLARMCTTKIRHIDQDSALRSASKRARHAPQLRIYQCPNCGGYHLTKLRGQR